MRSSNGANRGIVSATPRQLESIIRLAEARARIRFGEFVEKEDVEEAVRLIQVATQQAATDPRTGLIDMDILGAGTTSLSRLKTDEICTVVKNILNDNNDAARVGIQFKALYEDVRRKMYDIKSKNDEMEEITEYDFRNALKVLEDEDLIILVGNLKSPTIRMVYKQN